jgi:hypothetical protein
VKEKVEAKRKEYTSPKTRGTADDEIIGSRASTVGLVKLVALSAALLEVARSRVVVGITTSSTSSLDVSTVCKESG